MANEYSPPRVHNARMTTRSVPDLSRLIDVLCDARRHHSLADAAAFAHLPDSEADAYAVQRGVGAGLRLFADAVPRHWKSGGANRSAVLTHAPLPDAGVWASPADAGTWPFHLRLVEAEMALRLGADVTPEQAASMTPESAHACIDAMAVAIEMVDTRWRQPLDEVPALLKLADMGVHGALVLGDWVPYRRLDWSAQRCRIRIGRQGERVFTGTHSLADPAWLLPQWLCDVTQQFGTVPAGTVVTTGNWVGLLMGDAGDLVQAEFDGVGHARLQL